MFEQCISCSRFGVECGGQNFLLLSSDEFCQWLRSYKHHHHLTNATLAEKVDIPLSTVSRLLAGSPVGYDTAQRIVLHLAGGVNGDNCPFPDSEELRHLQVRASELESELSVARSLLLSDSERHSVEASRQAAEVARVVSLAARYRSALVAVSAAFVATLVSVILILAYDLSHPELGWFSVNQGGSELFFIFVLCAVLLVLLTVGVVLGIQRLARKDRR